MALRPKLGPGSGVIPGTTFFEEYQPAMKGLFDAANFPLTNIGGSPDDVTADLHWDLDAGLIDGMKFTLTWAASNGGPMTLSINGGPTVPILDAGGNVLTASVASEGRRSLLEYLSGAFRILSGAGSGAVPTGSIIDFAGIDAPDGWLFCAGQAVSRSVYPDLFAAIGDVYGEGDGTSTFNLPDLRGRVSAGRDGVNGPSTERITENGVGIDGTELGAAGGSQTHTLSISQMPSHTHPLGALGPGSQGRPSSGTGGSGYTGSAGGGGAHPNVQPTLILNKIIKT